VSRLAATVRLCVSSTAPGDFDVHCKISAVLALAFVHAIEILAATREEACYKKGYLSVRCYIFKNIFAEKLAEKLAFFNSKRCKQSINTLLSKKNAFFRRKLAQIAEIRASPYM
jgi:hypothetical protein